MQNLGSGKQVESTTRLQQDLAIFGKMLKNAIEVDMPTSMPIFNICKRELIVTDLTTARLRLYLADFEGAIKAGSMA